MQSLAMSLPTRERGLKLDVRVGISGNVHVAPYTGAWIEIAGHQHGRLHRGSLPTRERGLKFRHTEFYI